MWIPIKDYPNYEISDEGQVKNVKTGRILKFKPNERGYYYSNLSKNSKYKTHKLHRLVAEHFIPNPENKPEVNHKDANKQNNRADNLEWVTRAENRQHGYDLGLCKLPQPVVQYTLTGEYIAEYESLTRAAVSVGGKTCSIRNVCNGKSRKHKNYVWRWK